MYSGSVDLDELDSPERLMALVKAADNYDTKEGAKNAIIVASPRG